jgi:hypothetical protein
MAAVSNPRHARYMSYVNPLSFSDVDTDAADKPKPTGNYHGAPLYDGDSHDYTRPFAHDHEHTHRARITTTHKHPHLHTFGGVRNHHNSINPYHPPPPHDNAA